MEKKVIIYTFETCPYCIRAKKLLKNEGIPFSEIDITHQHNKLKELQLETNCDTVPQIFVQNKFIGGCDELIALYKNGQFNKTFK